MFDHDGEYVGMKQLVLQSGYGLYEHNMLKLEDELSMHNLQKIVKGFLDMDENDEFTSPSCWADLVGNLDAAATPWWVNGFYAGDGPSAVLPVQPASLQVLNVPSSNPVELIVGAWDSYMDGVIDSQPSLSDQISDEMRAFLQENIRSFVQIPEISSNVW